MILPVWNTQPSTHLSMLPLDTRTGNCSQATQAVVTGFPHHLSIMFLWYPHRTHQPRPSGSLTLTGTPKKGMTCQENIPTSSRNSFPVCSSTRNTQCLCTSRHKTPVVIPRPLGPGALGCRILGSLEGSLKASLQVGLQAFTRVIFVLFVLPAWVPLALLLLLNHIELSNFNPWCNWGADKIWTLMLLAGVCVQRRGWLGSPSLSWAAGLLGTWLKRGSYWVLEAGAAGSFCLTSQMLDFPLQ